MRIQDISTKTMRQYDITDKQYKAIVSYIKGDKTASQSANELNMLRQAFVQLVCGILPQLFREGKIKFVV